MSVGSISFSNYFFPAPVLPTINSKEDFIKVLNGKDFHSLRAELKSFFSKLSPQEQDEYLKEIAFVGFKSNNQQLIDRCLELLDPEIMEAMLAQIHKQDDICNQCIKYRQDYYKNSPETQNSTFNSTIQSDIKQSIPYLFHLVCSFIDTLIYSINLLKLGKQPESAFDANFQLDVYFKLFAIPVGLFLALKMYITHPVLLGTAFLASLSALLSSVYVYLKWLQPPPITIPYAINLTQAVKEGRIGPVAGRTVELQLAIQAITGHDKRIRKHPYLHGITGVGKNELINGIAYELFYNQTGQVPLHFRDKQVLLFDAPSLKNKNSFKNTTPMEEIEAAMGNHAHTYVGVFNEAQAVLNDKNEKDGFKTKLDTSSRFQHVVVVSSTNPQSLIDSDIKSRLDPFELLEMKEDSTLEVLTQMAASSLDITFSREDLKTFINPSTSKDLQPTPAMQNLNQALIKIQDNWDGKMLMIDLCTLEQEIKTLRSKITLHASGSDLVASKPIFDEITIQEEKKVLKIQEIETFKKTIETFKDMKKRGTDVKSSLPTLINRLQKPSWRDKWRIPALKVQYLFNEFYLLQAQKDAICSFAQEHKIMMSLKEALPPTPLELSKPIYVLDES